MTKKRDYKAEYQARMAKAKAETGKTYNENRRRGTPTYKGTPTGDTYAGLQLAFDHFNKVLFGGKLPECMITLRTFGKARGYFSANRFANMATITTAHEIAMDPKHFIDRSAVEVLSTLVHEMCHLWQQEHGKPSRSGYHNAEWGGQMRDVGLIPSNTGAEGGKATGQQMTHYIETGGRFEVEALKLVETGKFQSTWVDVEGFLLSGGTAKAPAAKLKPVKKPKGKSGKRTKYTCSQCSSSVWGKEGLGLNCYGVDGEAHDGASMLAS